MLHLLSATRWFWRIAACAGILALASSIASTQSRWWLDEPVRFVQTNLSETNSTVDPKALVGAVADFPANTFLVNMGGIVAQYPTRVPFHYASAFLPPGRDLFGEVLREARSRGIRVVGRFDLSKTQKAVFDAHPEWFFKRTNGEPAIYNGLYSTCINGNYYREHAMTILTEALDRYEVDGLFFNMFGNPAADYSGNPMGPCHCEACQARFRARYGRALPAVADADYRSFMADGSREVAAAIAELIHRKRPRAAFLTYLKEHTDGIMSESNTAVGRALPLWQYSASDNVNRALNSEPGKMAFNLSMSFVDYPWRYVHVPQAETQLRLYQNIAHGGPPAYAMVGTMDQQDRQGLIAARPVFPVAQGSRGSVRRPEERRSRPAARIRGHGILSRVLPAAQRAACALRRVREFTMDGRPVAAFRSRHRARPRASGARAVRPRRGDASCRRHDAPHAADRPRRRPPERDTGLLARARSHSAPLFEGHRSALPRRRVRGARAARAAVTHVDPAGDVRSAGKSVERQGGNRRSPVSCSPTTERAASRTSRGTSGDSTIVTARRDTPPSSLT